MKITIYISYLALIFICSAGPHFKSAFPLNQLHSSSNQRILVTHYIMHTFIGHNLLHMCNCKYSTAAFVRFFAPSDVSHKTVMNAFQAKLTAICSIYANLSYLHYINCHMPVYLKPLLTLSISQDYISVKLSTSLVTPSQHKNPIFRTKQGTTI